MLLAKYIIFFSILIWLATPLRQYKKNYFFFFLLYALTDPILILVHLFFHIHPYQAYSIFILLAVLSLLKFTWIKKYKVYISLAFLINIILSVYANLKYLSIDLILLNFIILIIFLSKAIFDVYKEDLINVFYFVICVYQISIIMKYVIFATNVKTGIIFFYLTSAFEILIGIYFIFYNERNSPKIKFKLKSLEK